jgi:hypothetical protein
VLSTLSCSETEMMKRSRSSSWPLFVRSSLRRDLRRGIGWGLAIGGVFTAYVAVVTVLRGSDVGAEVGLPLWVLIAGYLLGGAVAGALVGLFAPIGRTRSGAMLLGTMAALPISAFFTVLLRPPDMPFVFVPGVVLVSSVIMGAVGGASVWRTNRDFPGP